MQKIWFGFFMLLIIFLSTQGCSPSFDLLRTVDPYTKQQSKKPYFYAMRVMGGARIKILKFYVTKTIGCAVLEADNTRGETTLYINPHKTQFVIGKVGIWALKSTITARNNTFRKMATEFYKLNPKEVPM